MVSVWTVHLGNLVSVSVALQLVVRLTLQQPRPLTLCAQQARHHGDEHDLFDTLEMMLDLLKLLRATRAPRSNPQVRAEAAAAAMAPNPPGGLCPDRNAFIYVHSVDRSPI